MENRRISIRSCRGELHEFARPNVPHPEVAPGLTATFEHYGPYSLSSDLRFC